MSETMVVSEEVNPMLFKCKGCFSILVMQGGRLYTVSENFLNGLLKKHRVSMCGRILSSKISKRAQTEYNKLDINNLHRLLSTDMDVAEFIEKI